MAVWKQAVLKGFDAINNTAVIEISYPGKIYLEGIAVAKNIPVAEMVASRRVAVLFFDEHNARDAVVIAVF